VEGPSDRIYFNKWIELFGGELVEHDDYEFAFTGGSVLYHITYDEPSGGEMIEALRINRNAIVLMDRDRVEKTAKLKEWVERVREELKKSDGLAWITQGREVENYIPIEALRSLLDEPDLVEPTLDADIIKLIKDNGGGAFESRKTDLAERICRLLNRPMLEGCLDLKSKMEDVCQRIRLWNSR
jgi:hypothetical protein